MILKICFNIKKFTKFLLFVCRNESLHYRISNFEMAKCLSNLEKNNATTDF